MAGAFFAAVLEEARERGLLSAEHFTVDGTLLEAWASHKSFRPEGRPEDREDSPSSGGQDRNPDVNVRGQRCSNDTHASTTDPDGLARKRPGKEAKLAYAASVLTENGHGLVVNTDVDYATGTAEVDGALRMLGRRPERARRRTVGADKLYDTKRFVSSSRAAGFTPHVAPNITKRRGSNIDGRTTRHAGYAESQKRRKRVEQTFGWDRTLGLLRKLRHRGRESVDWIFTFTSAAYNLVQLRTLIGAEVCT